MISSTISAEQEHRLRELVLYVSKQCALDAHYGVLKLNKMLFYSDFLAYKLLGKPITGVEYRKYPHGPAPAMMKRLRMGMIQEGEAYEHHVVVSSADSEAGPMREKRLLHRKEPDTDVFSMTELTLVNQVIEWLRPMTGLRVSTMSHHHPGWELGVMGEKIPYASALLPMEPAPLSKSDRAWAESIAREYLDPPASP